MQPIKATVLDDDRFRLLAIPFGGPIPHPAFPNGVDLDGETFTERTDIKASWWKERDTDWHHSKDGPTVFYDAGVAMGKTVIGKAVNLTMTAEGWWVDVWLKHGERRLDLIRRLAEQAKETGKATVFGSSQPVVEFIQHGPWKGGGRRLTGLAPGHPLTEGKAREITVWPYFKQTLSTSPQNTYSVLRPLKADLEAIMAAESTPSAAFWSDIEAAVRNLSADLGATSRGELQAKAGRVLRAENEKDLMETLDALLASADRLRSVLSRQTGASG